MSSEIRVWMGEIRASVSFEQGDDRTKQTEPNRQNTISFALLTWNGSQSTPTHYLKNMLENTWQAPVSLGYTVKYNLVPLI